MRKLKSKGRKLLQRPFLAIIPLLIVTVLVSLAIWRGAKSDNVEGVSTSSITPEIIVYPSGDYPYVGTAGIQKAIIDARSGATILVKKGTYADVDLTINKRINLIGENNQETVLEGKSGAYNVLNIGGSSLDGSMFVKNFSISGENVQFSPVNIANTIFTITIDNNVIQSGPKAAIQTSDAAVLIIRNIIYGDYTKNKLVYGVDIRTLKNIGVTVINNTIMGFNRGMGVGDRGDADNQIYNNIFYNNRTATEIVELKKNDFVEYNARWPADSVFGGVDTSKNYSFDPMFSLAGDFKPYNIDACIKGRGGIAQSIEYSSYIGAVSCEKSWNYAAGFSGEQGKNGFSYLALRNGIYDQANTKFFSPRWYLFDGTNNRVKDFTIDVKSLSPSDKDTAVIRWEDPDKRKMSVNISGSIRRSFARSSVTGNDKVGSVWTTYRIVRKGVGDKGAVKELFVQDYVGSTPFSQTPPTYKIDLKSVSVESGERIELWVDSKGDSGYDLSAIGLQIDATP